MTFQPSATSELAHAAALEGVKLDGVEAGKLFKYDLDEVQGADVERLGRAASAVLLCGPDVGSGPSRPRVFGITLTHDRSNFASDGSYLVVRLVCIIV